MTEESKIDFGSIQIHKKALADIAAAVLNDVEGVSLAPSDMLTKAFYQFRQNPYPSIDVIIDKDGLVSVEVKVHVREGINIPDIARQTQDAIRTQLAKTADINVKDVNVNVLGIERGNP